MNLIVLRKESIDCKIRVLDGIGVYLQRNDSIFAQEHYMYGSSRLGSIHDWTYVSSLTPHADTNRFARVLGKKNYELSNHLGNVLATITDQKKAIQDGTTGTIAHWTADIASYSDYYPFGMMMTGRNGGGTDAYRYGFNGKERDENGMGGGGPTYDYGFRIYNPQIGKFLSVDPLFRTYPMLTPYQFSSNTPIMANDLDGLEANVVIFVQNRNKPVLESSFYVPDHTKDGDNGPIGNGVLQIVINRNVLERDNKTIVTEIITIHYEGVGKESNFDFTYVTVQEQEKNLFFGFTPKTGILFSSKRGQSYHSDGTGRSAEYGVNIDKVFGVVDMMKPYGGGVFFEGMTSKNPLKWAQSIAETADWIESTQETEQELKETLWKGSNKPRYEFYYRDNYANRRMPASDTQDYRIASAKAINIDESDVVFQKSDSSIVYE